MIYLLNSSLVPPVLLSTADLPEKQSVCGRPRPVWELDRSSVCEHGDAHGLARWGPTAALSTPMSLVDIDEHVHSGEFGPDEHDGYGRGKSRRKRGEEA